MRKSGAKNAQRLRRCLGLAVCVGVASAALPAWSIPPVAGEDAAVARAYGSGVHAYFSGDFQTAYDDLSDAVEAGTEDPRVLYFRGLAARRLGRLDESEADFVTAARMEAEGTGAWPVSRSLERVQGVDRLALERQRMRGQVVAAQQDHLAIQRRYSGLQQRQPEVLRTRRPEAVAAPAFVDEPAAEPVPSDPGT